MAVFIHGLATQKCYLYVVSKQVKGNAIKLIVR